MGRNIKQGFSYFPLDVDIFSDIKIRKLIKNHSGRALSVYICVLAFIYKNGYYVLNDEDFGFIVSEQTGDKVEFIDAVLDYCVKVGLFSKEMFNKGVYTSKGVQERYLTMCKASKRNIVFSEYTLISSEEIGVNSEEIGINSEKIPQSKGKESKVNISFLEKKKQKSARVDFDEEEKNNQPLSDQKETSPQGSAAPPPFNFRQAMLSAGFAADLTEDWLRIRKTKKAVNSERAFKIFLEQVQRTGRDKNEILALVVQKQWKGFEANWVQSAQQSHNSQQPVIIDEHGNIISGTHTTNTAGANVVGRQTTSNIASNMQGW